VRTIGLISGTSYDGVDAAVVDLRQDGDTLAAQVLAGQSSPLPPAARAAIRAVLPPRQVDIGQVCRLGFELGKCFGEAARSVAERAGGAELVCSHGQTVFHDVAADGTVAGTLQLGAPAVIAEITGLPVVSDLRASDIAAGGQGAPLAGLLDEWLLAGVGDRPVAVNLGGIANISVPAAPGRAAQAYDTGPANALMDAAVHERTSGSQDFDADASLARSGHVDVRLLERLLAEPYYRRRPPKSTGKELFDAGYVAARASDLIDGIGTADLLATLAELTARTVADAVRAARADVAVVAGGGVRNPLVMRRLQELLPAVRVATSADLGIDPDLKEAVLFAVLGWCTWNGIPGARTALTGAGHEALLGSVTPGPGRRWPTAPPPVRPPVRRLRLE